MSIKKAYWNMSMFRYKKSFKSSLKNKFFLLGLLGLLIASILMVSSELKIAYIDFLLSQWIIIGLGFISLGSIVGANWFKYGDYEEIKFLASLPVSFKSIAKAKIKIFNLEVSMILLTIMVIIAPWNSDITVVLVSLIKLIIIYLIIMSGLFLGLSLAFALEGILGKIGPYIGSILAIAGTSIVPLNFLSINLNDNVELIKRGVLITFIFILSYTICKIYLPKYFSILLKNTREATVKESAKYGDKSIKRLGNILFAVTWKDYLHYKREAYTWMQMLTIDALLIFLFMQSEKLGSLGTKTLLFSISLGIVGQISLYTMGTDGFLLEILHMVWGSLKKYFLIRVIVAFIFVSVPILITYFVIIVFMLGEKFTFGIFIVASILTFINVITAVGISVVFMDKKPIRNIPTKGTTIGGTLVYYVIGMGLPIVFAFINSGIAINEIPFLLLLYGAIQLIIALYLGVQAYLKIDEKISN